MSDHDDDNPGAQVFNFASRTGRTGFSMTPAGPSGAPGAGDPLGPIIPPQPTTAPTNGTVANRQRRSPLDTLTALPSPALTTPPVTATTSPEGALPDTFCSPGQPSDPAGPRMGALSMAAALATAVAALRGACIVLEDWRQRRMDKAAESAPLREARAKHKLAMAQAAYSAQEAGAKNAAAGGQAAAKHAQTMRGIGDKNAAQRAKADGKGAGKKAPSSQEYGHKQLGGRGTPGGTGNSGKGAGTAPKKAKAADSPKRPEPKKTDPKKPSPPRKQDSDKTNGKDRPGSSKKKAPTDGKSPSTSASTPSMERARRRQDRRDGHQGAKLQRKADRQAARLDNRAKDKDAARNRKNAARDARRAARDKVRDARRDAREQRKEQVRQDKFDKKRQQRADRDKDRHTSKEEKDKARAADGSGRTKLWDALKNDTKTAANERWTKRGGHLGVPPLWKNDKKRQKREKKQEQTAAPKAKDRKSGAQGKGPAGGGSQSRGSRAKDWWTKARDQARQKAAGCSGWMTDDMFGPPLGEDEAAPGTGAASGDPGASSDGSSRQRRSPYQNAGQASQQPTVTCEGRADKPNPHGPPASAIGQGVPSLPAAPEPHTQRPGTSRPRPARPMPPASEPAGTTKEPRMSVPRPHMPGGQQMAAEHETEITLDESLDQLSDLTGDGFKTHEQSIRMADRARTLRGAFEQLAAYLAVKHNLTGPKFSAAMAFLAESMDVLAVRSDDLNGAALNAAEKCETADNELNDAYRPYTQEAADRGLAAPSAPIHNQT